jgi:hypothetical protein
MTNHKRRGTRALGTNPRALGTNERATARNKWALRNWKRKAAKPRRPAVGNFEKGDETMRAILIDPEQRTITEIDFGGGGKQLEQLLGCHDFTTGSRPLNGSMMKGFDALYVSDDMLDERDDPKHWFQVDADRDPPSSFPIAGRGLVVGTDPDGEDTDARISRDELVKRITFTKRKFRGTKVTSGPGLIEVEQVAPIIDEE